MRLIDADAADVERICCYYGDNCRIEDVQEWLDDQPTVDAVPVVHAMWIHDINNLYGCSACFERETMSHKKMKRFCPNCGAKMDGGAKDEMQRI